MAAGYYHRLALKSDGSVWAWGLNRDGQLGIGNKTDQENPTEVPGLDSVVAVEAGYDFSMALKSDGTVWVWGSNHYGKLGVGTTTSSYNVPKQVPISNVIAISTNYEHSLALKGDGTLWAWGLNEYGEIGDGTTVNRLSPVQINLSGVISLSAGTYHSLVVKDDGTVWGWGNNSSGQLGIDNTTHQLAPVQIQNLSSVTSVATGNGTSFAILSDGTVWAWGANSSGQLGDGSFVNKKLPNKIEQLDSVEAVSVGSKHTVAIKKDGSIWMTGYGQHYQLGDLIANHKSTPQRVLISGEFKEVSAGSMHNVALKSDGTVWTWGYNIYNQLGDTITQASSTPIQVRGENGEGFLTDVIAVSAGNIFNLALKSDGTVWAWGWNSSGQLGNGTSKESVFPQQVKISQNGTIVPLTNIVKICAASASGGNHCLALKDDGTVWAWGSNMYSQLGDNTTSSRYRPIQIPGLDSVIMLSAGSKHSMALKSDGTIWTWGRNYYGQLGTGNTENSKIPVRVNSIPSITSISVGYEYSLAVTNNGEVYAWGLNDAGQLGNGTTIDAHEPSLACNHNGSNLSGIVDVSANDNTSIAKTSDGILLTWGNNSSGKLGNGTEISSNYPIQIDIDGLKDIKSFGGGSSHCLALNNDNTVWAWGSNSVGQLGDGARIYTTSNWVRVHTPTSGSVASANGTYHTAILNSDGTVWTAGRNQYGQLGIGTNTDSAEAVQITSLDAVSALAAGDNHTLALKNDGTVWAWGKNTYGQLGNQSSANASAPVQVLDENGDAYLEGVVAIAANADYSLALKADGSLWSWGLNDQGQLGDGTVNSHNLPAQVKGAGGTGFLTDVAGMAAGEKHALAVKSDGTVWAWGDNQYWQLGDHSDMGSFTPVQVTGSGGNGTLTDAVAVTAGRDASYALKADGTVWAWGYNAFGQIGDGSTTHAEAPVQVKGENGAGYLTGVAELSANLATVYAKKSDGTVWAWGNNEFGQFGNATTANSSTPVQVKDTGGLSGMEDVRYVSAGDHMVILIKGDGEIYASGYNRYGEFGIDTSNNRTTIPVRAFTKYILYDDYGNDFAEATEVFVNKTVTGEINYASDVDCFKFTVPFAGGYLFKSTGIIVPTVYNESYEPICAMGPTAFNLIPNKTYYIKLTGPVNAYSFTIIQPTNTLYIADAGLLEGVAGETELEQLQAGFVRAKIHVVNEHIMNKRFAVLAALVKKDTNAYVDHIVVDKMLGGGGSEYMTAGFNIPEDAQNYKIVIQLWDSMLTMNLIGSEWVLQ